MSCHHPGAYPVCPHCDAEDAPEITEEHRREAIQRLLEGKTGEDLFFESFPEVLWRNDERLNPVFNAIIAGDTAELGKLLYSVITEYILDGEDDLLEEIAKEDEIASWEANQDAMYEAERDRRME